MKIRHFGSKSTDKIKAFGSPVLLVVSFSLFAIFLVLGTGYFLTRRITQFVPLSPHHEGFATLMRFRNGRTYHIVINCDSITTLKPNLVSSFSMSGDFGRSASVSDLEFAKAFKCNWGRSSNPDVSSYAIKIYPASTPTEVFCKVRIKESMKYKVKNVWILETKP